MTAKERKWYRYWLFKAYYKEANALPFPWHWDFYELTWYDITVLDNFAEIFGIKATEKSRARRFWEQLQKCNKEV